MDFEYIRDLVPGPGYDPACFEKLEGCNCIESCSTSSCLCRGIMQQCEEVILECGPSCSCDPQICSNRVVQHGIQVKMKAYQAGSKGIGIMALENIEKGEFIAEYIGEVIGKAEAEKRWKTNETHNYIFKVEEIVKGQSEN